LLHQLIPKFKWEREYTAPADVTKYVFTYQGLTNLQVCYSPCWSKSNTKIIGLTSRKNVAFTNGLNLYYEVLSYDNYPGSPLLYAKATERWIYVDVAGNENLNRNLFAHFSSPYTGRLSACIGLTSYRHLDKVNPLTGAKTLQHLLLRHHTMAMFRSFGPGCSTSLCQI